MEALAVIGVVLIGGAILLRVIGGSTPASGIGHGGDGGAIWVATGDAGGGHAHGHGDGHDAGGWGGDGGGDGGGGGD
jgi:hypothetical protein